MPVGGATHRLSRGRRPAIDDGAVESLKQMEQLSLLFLLDTQMTASAVTGLQPFFSAETCRIIHQSGSYPGTRKSPLAMARLSTSSSAWRPAK